ncbi:MAG TPA: hydroxymethylbilane synthase [Actinomycetes bacterium]|jgi:hydroxymethylbilane synthase|nr:hydroxymethylbilane synthase [Actinomycetes bacterium]
MTGAEPAPAPMLRLATRGSALALAQSRLVVEGLRSAWPELRVELVTVVTEGDRRRDLPAAALGGKGIFTAAVQQAVLDGRADLAVHSAKDLPAAQVPGLVLAAVPERDDPRDVLVGRQRLTGLDDLAPGARVGTGSPRRVALLRFLRPDLELVPLRGNVDSRVRRVHGGELDAVVLAAAGLRRLGLIAVGAPSTSAGAASVGHFAGLRRLGLAGAAAVPLDPDTFTPAPGQGTLAVEARADDTRTLGLLGALTHRPSRVALRAERSFLQRLGGSCTLPAGALLRPLDAGPLELQGFLSALDGKGLVRERLRGPADDPEGLGRVLADRLLDACGPEVRALVESSRR